MIWALHLWENRISSPEISVALLFSPIREGEHRPILECFSSFVKILYEPAHQAMS